MKGIIMSGDHPRKILDGTKTMTRRVVKPELKKLIHDFDNAFAGVEGYKLHVPVRHPSEPDFSDQRITRIYCPYGQVGDRLWVRETCKLIATDDCWEVLYKADNTRLKANVAVDAFCDDNVFEVPKKWRPSIFMPRWASRITLEITDIRVERVQEITDKDCQAEGVEFDHWAYCGEYPNTIFRKLWDSLNAKRGYGWNANPWVWVISFRRLDDKVSEEKEKTNSV